MSVRRCIIVLSLFAWFAYARGRMVDCEMYPYHSKCRGAQTRKRFVSMETNKLDENVYHPKLKQHSKYNIPDIVSYLEKNMGADSLLDVIVSSLVEQRKANTKRINAKDRNRVRRTRDFLSPVDFMDNDY